MAAVSRVQPALFTDPLAEAADLIVRLAKVLDDRMTPAGHPYALVMAEHRGTCPYDRDSARCRDYRALTVAAKAWLEQYAPEVLD